MFAQEEYKGSLEFYRESLSISREFGNKRVISECLDGLWRVVAVYVGLEQGARLLAASEALREAIGVQIPPGGREDYDRKVAAVHDQLGEESFAEAWAEGRAMPMEAAIDYALTIETG